jgi:hypothetical protein
MTGLAVRIGDQRPLVMGSDYRRLHGPPSSVD